jgi:hypothetical protein
VIGVERTCGAERRIAITQPYWSASLSSAAARPVRIMTLDDLYTHIASGWPCCSLEGERWMDPAANISNGKIREFSQLYDNHGLLSLPLGRRWIIIGRGGNKTTLPSLLPFRPAWPGFAIDTLLFGLFAWCIVFGPFALRRVVRRRRGRCERCGYPRGPSGRCSECGAELF